MTRTELALAFIGLLFGSAVLSSIVNQIGEGIRQKRKHKFDNEDSEDKTIKALKDGMKWVIFDHIRERGLEYIAHGEIDFDDRRILKEMHKSYHDGLGGNGDLDKLMEAVYELPLKGGSK